MDVCIIKCATLLVVSIPCLAGAATGHDAFAHQAILSAEGTATLLLPRSRPGGSARLGKEKQHAAAALAAVDASGSMLTSLGSLNAAPIHQAVNGSTPTGTIRLGTPPVTLEVIFDTGSHQLVVKTWDTIQKEMQMVDGSIGDEVKPTSKIYNHNRSSTYTRQFTYKGGIKHPKKGFIAYGSGMAITDDGNDTVTVGSHTLMHFPLSEITADSLRILHRGNRVSGVMGLQHMKNNSLGESIFTRLRSLGMMAAFGYCRGNSNNGSFVWGDSATDGTSLDVIGQIHWAVTLGDISVQKQGASNTRGTNGTRHGTVVTEMPFMSDMDSGMVSTAEQGNENRNVRSLDSFNGVGTDSLHQKAWTSTLSGNPKNSSSSNNDPVRICPDHGCAAIIDTGSNIIAGPRKSLAALKSQVNVSFDCSNLKELPALSFFMGGFNVSIPPSAYVMKIKLPALVPFNRTHHYRTGHNNTYHPTPMNKAFLTNVMNTSSMDFLDTLVQDLHATYGLNLATVLEDAPWKNLWNMLFQGGKFCMPAFVPLDKPTLKGPLWVIGSPLFERYYARWSWPKQNPSPKIYLEHLHTATSCQQVSQRVSQVSTGGRGTTILANEKMRNGHNFMRSERLDGIRTTWESLEELSEPLEWEIDQIRYPHWARDVTDAL